MDVSLLTISNAASIMGIGRTMVYKLINRGDLPVVRIGRCVRIRAADLETFVAGLSQPERRTGDLR